MTPVWNDPINMPDDFSRPIYLLRKGKKFNEMFIFEACPQEQKKQPTFNFGEPQISRKEWLKFCEKKQFCGWSYYPYGFWS